MEASQVDARQRVRADMEVFSQTLAASSLTEACYHKIHRLHDDKIGTKGIADSVGCTPEEVTAVLWKPRATSGYSLFKASSVCSSQIPAKGVSVSERSKLQGELWANAKQSGVAHHFEALANEEKQEITALADEWDDFLSQWLGSRKSERAPAVSRERQKPVPVIKKAKPKTPAITATRPATALQIRNQELKMNAEQAAARRARWFSRHWDNVKPFLLPSDQDPTSDFACRILLHTAKDVATSGGAGSKDEMELMPTQPQPRSIVSANGYKMFPYQLEGMTWMLNQHAQGVGGILGDEMGLGKTLQVISFLAALKEGGEAGPHLIVAPLSVLPTWEREFQAWCPGMKVIPFHGNEEARKLLWRDHLSTVSGESFDVIITTYEMVTAATSMLTHRNYSYVILDEAQRIKNEMSNIGQAVRKCRSVSKLLITGTPLQNDMHELWALLNWMFPDVFANSEQFDLAFRRHFLGTNVDLDLVCAAHKLLQPLMIRRLKKDVQTNLPKKTVLTIWCPITDMQRFFYKRLLQSSGCAGQLLVGHDAGGGKEENGQPASVGGSKNKLMNLLMQLRKVVNHPYMFPEADPNPLETDETIVTTSAKMMVLDRLLRKLKAEGHRVLVYSQFTSMLDVIQDYCSLVGHGFRRLDGSTNLARRKYEIKMFNAKRGDQFVYLLSTRAGALGITLTGADTVIMYDSDWNPTWDKQAHDRVHRIGQDRPVTIYQLLCKDTVEQRVFQRAAQKTSLNELVLRDDTESKSDKKEDVLSSTEVKKMLRCGVVKILEGESTVMTEELVDNLINEAHMRGEEDKVDPQDEIKEDDVQAVDVFNQKLLEVRQFGGKVFDNARDAYRDIASQWAAEIAASSARRERVSTVEQVGAYQVLKINRSQAAGDAQPSALHKEKPQVIHDSVCLYCGLRGGSGVHALKTCKSSGRCHRAFHEACMDAYLRMENAKRDTMIKKPLNPLAGLSCTQHACSVCQAKASHKNGVIFRCWKCPLAFCGDCLPDEFVPLDNRSGEIVDKVIHLSSAVEYLVCDSCTKGKTRKVSLSLHATGSQARSPPKSKKVAAHATTSINNVSREVLTKIVSDAMASRILSQACDCPFRSEEDLRRRVPGLGKTKVEQLKEYGISFPPGLVIECGDSKQPGPMSSANEGDEWHTTGPYMNRRVRRAVLGKEGSVVDFSDGSVVGYLPVEQADYLSELTGKPAALWRIRHDDVSMGVEDLEWVEVEDAMESYQMQRFQPPKTQAPQKRASPSSEQSSAKRLCASSVSGGAANATEVRPWSEWATAGGRKYYFNSATKVSQWAAPQEPYVPLATAASLAKTSCPSKRLQHKSPSKKGSPAKRPGFQEREMSPESKMVKAEDINDSAAKPPQLVGCLIAKHFTFAGKRALFLGQVVARSGQNMDLYKVVFHDNDVWDLDWSEIEKGKELVTQDLLAQNDAALRVFVDAWYFSQRGGDSEGACKQYQTPDDAGRSSVCEDSTPLTATNLGKGKNLLDRLGEANLEHF